MTATTTNRDTRRRNADRRTYMLAPGAKVLGGTIAVLNASNVLQMGATSTSLNAVGVFRETVDNTNGTAPVPVDVELGVFGPFVNEPTDLIEAKNTGGTCYIVDNQTVSKGNGSSTRSKAGITYDVDAEGVWVQFF